jgi:hypothetical protein
LVIFSVFGHNTSESRIRILSVLTLLNTTESGSRKAKNDTKMGENFFYKYFMFLELGVLSRDFQAAPRA